jgi:hypothetical protein
MKNLKSYDLKGFSWLWNNQRRKSSDPPTCLQSTVFQDCRIRPLPFLSVNFRYLIASANIRTFFGYTNLFRKKTSIY